jgi:phosphoribosylformylglycinamidine synthase
MAIWLVGPESGVDFAGSAFARMVLDHRAGRPLAPDADIARAVTGHSVRLAREVPVLHDVSAGGLAVAIAEICIGSGFGATIDVDDWRLLLDEAPHRVVVVAPPFFDLGVHDVPARRIGTIGGDAIDFGPLRAVPLAKVRQVWSQALPRRLS